MRELLNEYYSGYAKQVNRVLKSSSFQFALDFLQPSEIPEKVVNTAANCFLWATSIRVFYVCALNRGLFKPDEPLYKEFSYQSLTAVRFKADRISTGAEVIFHISTTAASGKVEETVFRTDFEKEKMRGFAYYVRDKVAELKASYNSDPLNTDNIVDRLERLAKLKQAGAITEQEFLTAKKTILDN